MLETLLTLDGALLLWLQDLRTPILNALFSFYTQLGNAGLVWIVLSAVLLLHPRTRKAGFWALMESLMPDCRARRRALRLGDGEEKGAKPGSEPRKG